MNQVINQAAERLDQLDDGLSDVVRSAFVTVFQPQEFDVLAERQTEGLHFEQLHQEARLAIGAWWESKQEGPAVESHVNTMVARLMERDKIVSVRDGHDQVRIVRTVRPVVV